MKDSTKDYIKGIIKNVIAVLIGSVMLLALIGGCIYLSSRPYTIHYDGYFQYIIVEKSVAIIGLTTAGYEQEVIDIPREIDGRPVRYIGYTRKTDFRGTYFSSGPYYFNADNLKKLYVHENIERVYEGALKSTTSFEVMVCTAKSPYSYLSTIFSYTENFYVYKSIFDANKFGEYISSANIVSVANIVFINNYSTEINDGYYSLDNVQENEKIPVPTEPARSGYEFSGWYTEPECINLWDFDVSPTLEEGEEFRLYAGWREI